MSFSIAAVLAVHSSFHGQPVAVTEYKQRKLLHFSDESLQTLHTVS